MSHTERAFVLFQSGRTALDANSKHKQEGTGGPGVSLWGCPKPVVWLLRASASCLSAWEGAKSGPSFGTTGKGPLEFRLILTQSCLSFSLEFAFS